MRSDVLPAFWLRMVRREASGNSFQLFRRQFLTKFLRNGEELFGGPGGFNLFLLLVGQGAENVFGNVHVEILLIFS